MLTKNEAFAKYISDLQNEHEIGIKPVSQEFKFMKTTKKREATTHGKASVLEQIEGQASSKEA